MRHSILGLAVLALLVADMARADFVLTGSEHLEINSSHVNGALYDSSTADVMEGGSILNYAWLNNTSSMTVIAGYISQFEPHNSSVANVFGGKIDGLYSFDGSTVNIFGGDIFQLSALDTSVIDIYGGSIDELSAEHFSRVTLHGYDFNVTGGLHLENERVLGHNGLLAGKWFNGAPWSVSIRSNPSSSTIWAVAPVPEPSALVLLGMGAVGLFVYGWRRRRRAA